MDIQGLDSEIQELEKRAEEKDEQQRILLLKKAYSGPDELITSEKYKKDITKDKVLYKAMSGLPALDKVIEGFRPGTLIIISGPTKQGKTTFCQTLTHNFTNNGFPCLWFSFDTPPIELIERFPKLPTFYLPRRNEPEKKLEWIESKIVEGIAKYNTRMVFIDHLGFLTRFADKNSNYATELTSIARELKEISIRWNVTIFLNHHIRQIDADVTPNWTHLKDSSGPAQDSDITIMIWRLNKRTAYGIEYDTTSRISIQLHRRTGKTGSFSVQFKNNLFTETNEHEAKPF